MNSDLLRKLNLNPKKRSKDDSSCNDNTSIVISGPAVVGKTTLAEGIAKAFGYSVYNGGDILKNIAKEKGYKVTGKDWWDTPEAIRFMRERKKDITFDIK